MRRSMAGMAAGVGVCASVALGQHGGDIVLRVEGGRMVTGVNVEGTVFPERVFEAELDAATGFSDEPGFDNLPGTFQPGSQIGFRVLGSLLRWDGAGFPSTPPEERMEIAFSTLSVVTPPDGSTVEGFSLAVAPNGEWHRHLEYTLLEPRVPGVYLLALELHSTEAGLGGTEPFWIVFALDADEEDHEDATAWAREHLAGQCVGDFNRSGGAPDDADIAAFFGAWSAGDPSADVNRSGGTPDDTDVAYFFLHWSAGC